jgi:putative transposase
MKRSKFSEHQIIAILKAVEAGRTVKDVCREHEISKQLATLLSPDGSTSLLHPGSVFELFEGYRLVARGEVL